MARHKHSAAHVQRDTETRRVSEARIPYVRRVLQAQTLTFTIHQPHLHGLPSFYEVITCPAVWLPAFMWQLALALVLSVAGAQRRRRFRSSRGRRRR
jgi:hypothetical protein